MAKRPAAPPRVCNKCGNAVTTAGPKSASGLYYCKRDVCQAQKKQDWYALNYVAGRRREDAPTSCFNCGASLTPRKTRSDDIPGKRWCNAHRCRVAKRAHVEQTRSEGAVATEAEFREVQRMNLILARALIWGRVKCETYERPDAVPGYGHPRLDDKSPCFGTGTLRLGNTLLAGALWPDEFEPPAYSGREYIPT